MNIMKILNSIALGTLILCSSGVLSAASIGRSSSVSVSRSPATPSRPSVAPATPSKPAYFGSSSQSIGVQKPAVAQAAQNKTPITAAPQPARSGAAYTSPATPSYTPATVPAPAIASPVTNGSTFMSSLGGSFVGSALGNVLFGHGSGSHGSTTVVNNGAGGSHSSTASPSAAFTDSNGFTSVPSPPKASYGVFNFLGDLIGFILSIGVIAAFVYGCRQVWLRYKTQKKKQ